MPIYEYRCTACGEAFEKIQKVGAAAPGCPACGAADTQRQVSLSSFHLKGSGWYSTDYKASAGGTKADTASASSDGGGESSGGGGGHSCGPGCGHAH